jgi:hypothetical protein
MFKPQAYYSIAEDLNLASNTDIGQKDHFDKDS